MSYAFFIWKHPEMGIWGVLKTSEIMALIIMSLSCLGGIYGLKH